uniref:DEP domain-containing protein n=1 Tax=Romanomermis culicivorax TaxID=13658 RepID=A0A915JD24_ROMCU
MVGEWQVLKNQQAENRKTTHILYLNDLLTMDEICMKMQSTETGLMVKTLKYFRVSVPASFSGQDLIEWLSRTLKIDDNAECVHLANQLCVYGYLFPVFDNATTSIRDNNTLYRSQIPYFWPSLNSNPDDVEYAIYLSKRLLRNEEKHGLSESEAEAFNKTRELLGHMWDFIQNQAEMQLKLFKEKKKVEKVVFDSQEKAFWRVHRPQHGQSVCLDERYGKLEKKIRKRTSKEYHQELDRLKFALKTKPWLKSPKAVETLVSGCEQFTEYDSFLTPLKDPSNPWITDDQSLWVLNADM